MPDEQEVVSSLFQADSGDELVTLLGFSHVDITARVAETIEKRKAVVESSLRRIRLRQRRTEAS